MKTLVTICWSYTVETEVDPDKMEDRDYLDKIRSKVIKEAGINLNRRDGIVTDCEDFPELAE